MIAVGLGANIGTVAEIVDRFRVARQQLGGRRSAALYRSAPLGLDQADFLNSAVLIDDAGGSPEELLERLHAIEAEHGRARVREVRGGPRTLDLDVLVWDRRALATPALVVPHPRLSERRFALLPLADLLGEPWPALAEAPGVCNQWVERVTAIW